MVDATATGGSQSGQPVTLTPNREWYNNGLETVSDARYRLLHDEELEPPVWSEALRAINMIEMYLLRELVYWRRTDDSGCD
jgi:hypothetical protein